MRKAKSITIRKVKPQREQRKRARSIGSTLSGTAWDHPSLQPANLKVQEEYVDITIDPVEQVDAVESATVKFNDRTKYTISDGTVSFSAPSVNEDTIFGLLATKQGYLNDTIWITVLNQEEPKGWIYGVVSDNLGSLLENASVCARISDEDISTKCTLTDEEGRYVIYALIGQYIVE